MDWIGEHYIDIATFPLLPSGKRNRQALPDPGYDRPLLDAPVIAPHTLFSEEVAKIGFDVLGLERVGIHDPFLELGGDSLRAIQVISRVLNPFQVNILISTLLETATVAAMAVTIATHKADKVGCDEMVLLLKRRLPTTDEIMPRRATSGAYSLSFAQQRLWFLGQMEPESPFHQVAT